MDVIYKMMTSQKLAMLVLLAPLVTNYLDSNGNISHKGSCIRLSFIGFMLWANKRFVSHAALSWEDLGAESPHADIQGVSGVCYWH